ncbi:S8 family serine peptidase, partial [Microcoleus sp. Z1_B5]|uniref:S8 family serine peptidase n=1 Tax=Microcoleus sp. Z1_B5 TaxID=3055430 RepID=UPI002FD36C4F
KPALVTEVEKTETPQVVVAANPVESVKESQPTVAVESKETPAIVPPTAAEIMPVVGTNTAVDLRNKEIVTQTETAGVNDAAPKESLPISPTVAKPTEDNSTAAVTEPVKQEVVAQNNNNVNADWIARLESIKQRLSNLGGADVVAENAIDRTLIARLETMTEKLREKTRSTPVSDNTATLISRLEDMVVKVAPKPVEPVQPVQFEFPQADRPLVGFINDTGLTVDNPAEEKSLIVAGEKPENSTNNPSQPVARTQDNSSQWVESLIKFVDAAKVSKQPHAVVNININLTQTQPDGTVIPRSELTVAERAAIAYAYQNKVIVVVPAGDNPGTMSALGLLSKEVDNVVTVGAAQRFNNSVALSNAFKLADYSGSGNTLDILANGSSGSTSSTEVAAVEVTNAIAQVLAANPKLNYTQAIDAIKRSSTDLDRPNWDTNTGSGLLNVAAAVQLAKVTTPALYTIKPGQRSITDVFISQHPSTKQLPGDPTHPTVKVPGIPQTNVDSGGNNLANATQLIPSATEDVIDQVSSVDPSDIYRVDSRYLNNAKFSVLSGDLSVSYLTTSGQLLGTQSLSKGSHKLQLPLNAPAEVIVKIDQRNAEPATYVISGFESTATEPFNIDLEYETPLSASQQAIMQAAAKSVAGLIGKGLPSAVVDGKIIDDINIKISTANIDGASGTQARTKIDFMRYGSMLPAQSLVQFDAADIAELERSGKLFSVVQHEFLHALGFGNLWEAKGLVDYAGTPLAQYNGAKAVDAFKDLGGLTDAISLETEGKGSAGFHWNEALFQDEVMTADLNFSGKAGNAPISPVTIASLADLGYEVNLNAATPDFGLFGGGRFNAEDLTPEQIEAFRQLAEIFGDGDEPSEPAILQEVDPSKVAPEIWAHAERAPDGQYYDWQPYKLKWGDTLSGIAAATMGSGSATNYWWIANHNGIPNPDKIYEYDTIDIPDHRANYEQEQEAERQRREQELQQRQEQEARERQAQIDQLNNSQAEQERLRQDEERRRQEAEANQRALEEQARRLAEDQERRRREREEYEREQARLAELRRQAEIARQQGKGGLEWYLAKPMPEFGPVDPFETSLTGETVGNLVPDDYYRFTLSRGGRITAELRQLLADADLVLYDVRNEPIAYSMREGITDEQIIADLIPGTYMLRVNSPKGVTTDYELIVKFQHKLSATQTQPLPPGWRPSGGGNSGGSGGGNTSPGVTFADPRIKQIYNTALNQFETAERGKANALILDLEAEKRQYQQELNDLLARMNAEQRNKVYTALDGVRNDAFGWLDSLGEANGFDNLVNGIFDQIPSWVYNVWGIGDALRIAKDTAKGAFNGALSLIKGKVNSARTEIKNAVSWFVEALKNAYRTGGEINSAIEGLARELKGKIDAQVTNINNGIDWFKTEAIKNLGSLRNVGVGGWNFYDNLVVPQADNIANLVKNGVGAIANSLKGTVDYVKPRAQKTVADILSALLGDQTGNLYNKINGIDQQIAATTRAVEERMVQKAVELKVDVDNWLNKLANDGKKLLDTILTSINSPGGQVGIEVVKVALGFVPIVGQAIDVIDTAVALWKFAIEGKRDTETYIELLGSLAGWFPGVGDAIKGVAKIAFKGPIGALLRKLGPDVTKQIAKVFKEAKWKEILLDVVEGIGEIWSKFDSTMDETAGWILDLMPGVRPALAGVGDLIRKFSDDAANAGDSLDGISKTIAKKIDDTSEQIAKEDKKEDTPLQLPGPVKINPGSIDDLLINAKKHPKNDKSIQYDKNGGVEEAWQDYQDLTQGFNPKATQTPNGNVFVAELPDGSTVVGRSFSSGGSPTIEIKKPNGEKIKVRYVDKYDESAYKEYPDSSSLSPSTNGKNNNEDVPQKKLNEKGELTNGIYTVNANDMAKHKTGSLKADAEHPKGISQFLANVDAESAILDAAAYADKYNLWSGSDLAKATVPTNDYVGVVGETGEKTKYLHVYRTKNKYVHGSPATPP